MSYFSSSSSSSSSGVGGAGNEHQQLQPFQHPPPLLFPPFHHPPPFLFYGGYQFSRPFYPPQLPLQYFHQQQPPPPPPPQFLPPQPTIIKPLNFRNWQHALLKPNSFHGEEKFIVLSYNILADYLASKHRNESYFHLSPRILNWESRSRNIIWELGLWSADIICLQEVDRFQDLEKPLKLRGYAGIWKKRTGVPVDGCAILWKTTRFELLHEEYIEFNQLGLLDNVAQICVFKSRINRKANDEDNNEDAYSPNHVVICNIHVLWNPRRGDVKLGQVRVLLNRAQEVSKMWNNAPVVVCGDFNCTPKSPLYEFISEQKLNLIGTARDKISGQSTARIHPPQETYNPSRSLWTRMAIETASGNGDCSVVEHPLKLKSAYTQVEDCLGTRDLMSKEPQVTCYNRTFMGTVDYIWCSKGLETVNVLETIPKRGLLWTPGFPTLKWGSDHMALASQLAFKKM